MLHTYDLHINKRYYYKESTYKSPSKMKLGMCTNEVCIFS